jgi:iron complex outermembrane receptor protein
MQQIQGKVAGLQITQSSGDPNQGLNIKLRGQASLSGSQTPLIVLDGVPLSDPSQISNLLPADIASYDVLKDASAAAIYGSQGANGVIIINTKKGQAGQVKVEYNGFVTRSEVSKYYPLLNLQEWKTGSTNYLISQGATPGSADSTVAGFGNGNTDWQKAITRKTFSQNQSIGISGGTGHLNFRGSVNYLDQQGVVLNSYKKGLGLNLNVEEKAINNRLDIQLGLSNTSFTRGETDPTQLTYALYNPPSYPVRNPDGSYFTFFDYGEANPVEHLNEALNQWKENFTVERLLIDFTLIPGLKVGSLGSMSHFNQQRNVFVPTYPSEGNLNQANVGSYNNDQNQINAHVQFNHNWGLHDLAVSAIYEYTYFTDGNFTAQGSQYPVEANQSYNIGSGNQVYDIIGSTKEESMLESYVARATYNYNSKYYATATFRRDGSSKFGSNNRFGNFPSFDLAWAISQESFMKNVTWVDFLKIRAGYGVTGNQGAISDYNTLFLLGTGGRYFDASSTNFPYPYSYSPSQNANPNLKWETRHGRNVGVSFALFGNRLNGDIDYYNDKTTNLLDNYTVPTPPFYINSILANVGSLTNKGLDISLSYDVIKGRHFSWTAGGQITFMKTRILNLNGQYDGYKLAQDSIGEGVAEGRGLSTTPLTWYKAGYSPFVFFLPHFAGLDQNGNQLFDSAGAKVPIGHAVNHWIDPAPKFNYGFNSTFTYDRWSLNFLLRGVAGQKIFNNVALNEAFIKRLPGDNIFRKGLTNGITDAATVSDLWLEKAGFLRLDNLTLAYTFKGLKGIDNLRIYATGNNLFVITKYSGLDPEIRTSPTVVNGTTYNQAYIDAGNGNDGYYYRARSYTLGVSVGF